MATPQQRRRGRIKWDRALGDGIISEAGSYLHVLSKYYGKPFEGWREDRDVFDVAERRNLLTDELDLRSKAPPIKRIIDVLDALDGFVRANHDELEVFADREFDAPLETDNEDFWREHLL